MNWWLSEPLNEVISVTCSKNKIIEGVYNAFEGCHWYGRSFQIIRVR
jgi:hypothetical protein